MFYQNGRLNHFALLFTTEISTYTYQSWKSTWGQERFAVKYNHWKKGIWCHLLSGNGNMTLGIKLGNTVISATCNSAKTPSASPERYVQNDNDCCAKSED